MLLGHDSMSQEQRLSRKETSTGRRVLFAAAASCALVVVVYATVRQPSQISTAADRQLSESLPSTPKGVNFGGWLCLEDWFFSGDGGRYGMPDPWPSEGILTKRLNDTLGPKKTAEAFMAHRRSFIGHQDLAAVAELGIRSVRVPITWAAFADALKPIDPVVYGSHDPDEDAAVLPDPFYIGTAAVVTVPRNWMKTFLHKAADYDIKILWDLHGFPGGSSIGTYNGVWPSPPKFWNSKSNIGDKDINLTQAGHWVAQALIDWIAGLDDKAKGAVLGVTLMNEPGHLAAFQPPETQFVKEQQILDWLEKSSAYFRSSELPSLGMKLYINIIETAFKDFDASIIPWYTTKFTKLERYQWAVMDRHWYAAWSGGSCSGRVIEGGGYYCDQPLGEIRDKMKGCVGSWAEDFAKKYDGLRAISEFSGGTFDDARNACNDPVVTKALLDEKVKAFNTHSIEPFFWTWRMPYGPAFEPGWSLKYTMGKEPPKNQHPCFTKYEAPPAIKKALTSEL